MRDNSFSQGGLLRQNHYQLERDGVTVSTKTLLSSHKYHIYYEQIPPKVEEVTLMPRKWLIAACLCSVISLIAIPVLLAEEKSKPGDLSGIWFWGGLAIVSWIVVFAKRASLLVYSQNGATLVLRANAPSSEAVAAFVRKMFAARNTYLRQKYGQMSLADPLSERLNRLELLRNQEAISEEEYQTLRKRQTSDSVSPGPVGFGVL